MKFLSVVTWKWGTLFGPEYVNNLQSMLKRHLHEPHQLHCITDDPTGIDDFVICHPMYTDHSEMKVGRLACFRRLRIFDKAMAQQFGPRILQMDLDIVITGDFTPVVDRPEPLVMYLQSPKPGKFVYNPSLLLMDAGILHHMWERFHGAPVKTWMAAKRAGWNCSDMSVINHTIFEEKIPIAYWDRNDKVLTYWQDIKRAQPQGSLPEDTRAVLFFGRENPADKAVLEKSPWVREHWI